MDILVTTPKSEIENSKREGDALENDGGYWFRVFRFRPKVNNGDKIYFIENGFITGYGIIFNIEQQDNPAVCDVTNRQWGRSGDWKVCYKDWHWLKNKIPHKGFQGIKYINDDLLEKLSFENESLFTE